MGVEKTDSSLTIEFRRRRFDKVNLGLLLFFGVFFVVMTLRLTIFQPKSTIVCTRATDICQITGRDIFGKGYDWELKVSDLVSSEAVKLDNDERQWKVQLRDGSVRDISNPSGRSVQKDQFKRLAPELQQFITDPARASFSGEFDGIGAPPTPVFVIICLLVWFILLRYLDGWFTRCVFDRTAGTLTVTRRPSLFGAGEKKIPLSAIKTVDIKRGFIFMVWSTLPTLTLRLLDERGKKLFARREAIHRKAISELEQDLAAVKAFLQS